MPVDEAISASEADAAFVALAEYPIIVLAVSGGPDSMALLELVAEWRGRRDGPLPRVHAATIDHGLRAQSREEAETVAAQASRLGVPHVTLPWLGEKPTTGLPAASRDARYQLLAEHAAKTAAGQRSAVVTAHHADDQAETLLMRLARGSGVDGLAAMQPTRKLTVDGRVTLLRPLLAFSKARLDATVRSRGVAVADDPTNRDVKFERPRLRASMPLLHELGLSPEALSLSARRLGDARAALDYAAEAFEATVALELNNGVFANFLWPAFDGGPAYLRQRVVARLIEYFGGASPSPQLSEIESIVRRLESGREISVTLGGAVIVASDQRVRIWREPGRLSTNDVLLPAGGEIVWDKRFRIACRPGSQWSGSTIRPLGRVGLSEITNRLDTARLPAQAAISQPALWHGETLVAAPTLPPFAVPGGALGADPDAASASPLCSR